MEARIREHQDTQDLRWQVHELTDVGLRYWRSVEKLRDMIMCLLKEHEAGSTDEFWKRDLNNIPHWDKNYAKK